MTKEEFEQLTPYERGYAVYMLGCRDDEPNVPEEKCPYRIGTPEELAWSRGQTQALINVQDAP